MAAHESLGPQFMYHHAPVTARGAIRQQGLKANDPFDPEVHEDESEAPRGVYLMHHDHGQATDMAESGRDVWRVNVKSHTLHDDPSNMHTDQDYKYSPRDIGPENLTLARKGHSGRGLGPLGGRAIGNATYEMDK